MLSISGECQPYGYEKVPVCHGRAKGLEKDSVFLKTHLWWMNAVVVCFSAVGDLWSE